MTAQTTLDSCPFISEMDVISDQCIMADVIPEDREGLAVAIIDELTARNEDCFAAWINTPDAWPLTNLVDGSDEEGKYETMTFANGVAIWHKYIDTGKANIDLFRHRWQGN
jgi:hypothetical protein